MTTAEITAFARSLTDAERRTMSRLCRAFRELPPGHPDRDVAVIVKAMVEFEEDIGDG